MSVTGVEKGPESGNFSTCFRAEVDSGMSG